MIKVLFLCVHNSARSQMAEAYLKKFGGDRFRVESAGLDPGSLNALVVEVMKEDGIDISKNRTKDVLEFFEKGTPFDFVITVCDAKASERCPVFPGLNKKINWAFDDPSQFAGDYQKRVESTRAVRDQIRESVLQFIKDSENK